jgi:hypothetical protein
MLEAWNATSLTLPPDTNEPDAGETGVPSALVDSEIPENDVPDAGFVTPGTLISSRSRAAVAAVVVNVIEAPLEFVCSVVPT